jgi:chromosome segregation ATPase
MQNSEHTQTDEIAVDRIRRVVENIRKDLDQLDSNNACLCKHLEVLNREISEINHDNMLAAMSELSATMSKIWEKIMQYRSKGCQLDQEIQALQEEKG